MQVMKGGTCLLLPQIQLPYDLIAGQQRRRPGQVPGVHGETPYALDSRSRVLRLPTAFSGVIRRVELPHRLTPAVHDLVRSPVHDARLAAGGEVVDHGLVVARGR